MNNCGLQFPIGCLCLLIATSTLQGCSSSEDPQGEISGSVTYKGQPLTTGDINFYQRSTGEAASIPIDETGHFALATPLKTGTYTISFTPPEPKQLPPGSPPQKADEFPVPKKYFDIANSDLTQEVIEGTNTIDVVIPE